MAQKNSRTHKIQLIELLDDNNQEFHEVIIAPNGNISTPCHPFNNYRVARLIGAQAVPCVWIADTIASGTFHLLFRTEPNPNQDFYEIQIEVQDPKYPRPRTIQENLIVRLEKETYDLVLSNKLKRTSRSKRSEVIFEPQKLFTERFSELLNRFVAHRWDKLNEYSKSLFKISKFEPHPYIPYQPHGQQVSTIYVPHFLITFPVDFMEWYHAYLKTGGTYKGYLVLRLDMKSTLSDEEDFEWVMTPGKFINTTTGTEIPLNAPVPTVVNPGIKTISTNTSNYLITYSKSANQ